MTAVHARTARAPAPTVQAGLRRHQARTTYWIRVTAGAWVLGLTEFLAVATPLWQPSQSIVVIAAVGVLAAVVMAAVVAAVTGWAVVRLTGSHASRPG